MSNYLLVEHLVQIYKYVGQQLKVISVTNLLQLGRGPHSIEFKRCIDYTPVSIKEAITPAVTMKRYHMGFRIPIVLVLYPRYLPLAHTGDSDPS